jgi:hypothetical protein
LDIAFSTSADGAGPSINSSIRIVPYALWTLLDGTQILTNRKYQPLMRRRPGQPAEPAEQRWYTDIRTEQWIDNPPSWEWDDDFRCYRWSKDVLSCFSSGGDIRKYLALHPVKMHSGGSFTIIDGKSEPRPHTVTSATAA